jgi:hypothetical protein
MAEFQVRVLGDPATGWSQKAVERLGQKAGNAWEIWQLGQKEDCDLLVFLVTSYLQQEAGRALNEIYRLQETPGVIVLHTPKSSVSDFSWVQAELQPMYWVDWVDSNRPDWPAKVVEKGTRLMVNRLVLDCLRLKDLYFAQIYGRKYWKTLYRGVQGKLRQYPWSERNENDPWFKEE